MRSKWKLIAILTSMLVTIVITGTDKIAHANQTIMGGNPVTDARIYQSVPRVIDFANKEEGDCSGVLIRQDWVLTAQHCVANDSGSVLGAPSDTQVTFQKQVTVQEFAGTISAVRVADRIVVEPGYRKTFEVASSDYSIGFRRVVSLSDLALIHLNLPAPFWSIPFPLASPSQSSLWANDKDVLSLGYTGTNTLLQASRKISLSDGTHRTIAINKNTAVSGSSGIVQPGDSGGPLLSDDGTGNLILIGVCSIGGVNVSISSSQNVWSATGMQDPYTWITTNAPAPTNILYPNQTLGVGQQLISQNSLFTLVMQPDGNLVEYAVDDSPVGKPVWASNTAGHQDTILMDQGDGNVVLIAPGNQPIWSTNTAGQPEVVLLVQNDMNLVAVAKGNRPVWATNVYTS